MKKFLSLSLFVLALSPVNGLLNYAQEVVTPETQTTNTYKLVANNFMVNVNELPEVKSCEVIRATSCVGSYQTWPEEMVMYVNLF